MNIASIPNFTLLASLEGPDYYYPGWGGVGVEIIRIKALLSSAGLAYWTGTELDNRIDLITGPKLGGSGGVNPPTFTFV